MHGPLTIQKFMQTPALLTYILAKKKRLHAKCYITDIETGQYELHVDNGTGEMNSIMNVD